MPEGQKATNVGPAAAALGAVASSDAHEKASLARASDARRAGGKPQLKKFAYGFWDPEMKPFRKIALKILGPTVVLSILVMWACLPAYWGSLWKSNHFTDRLTVRVIDRDGGEIGSAVSQGLLQMKNLKFFSTDPSAFPTNEDVAEDVVQEGVWAAIVISEGATEALAQARSIGNSSYNGSNAITVYYAQARNELATGNYLQPYILEDLGMITGRFNAESVAQYLGQNAGNATAMEALARAPTTVVNPVYWTLDNLRPYNQPVATAITLVGLIYMLIFAFIITMTNNAVREIISPFLTTKSYIFYRLASPLLCYLPISFLFAMVSLPFKVHFGAHFTYAGGFFLWAFTLFLGMASVGLATEFAITILGPKFMAFFLIPLIIVNVSVASLPHELQPWIFRYGVAMPFYNVGKVVRTIIFNTKNEIAMNLGILLAWIALSLITIPLAVWLFRRKAVNAHRRAVAENEYDVNMPDGGRDRSNLTPAKV
ncbi:hypothetical protein BD324DRAFT_576967 [Kockovaella imperatae]|uniref:DUF3533 domain-containing protein n=1 Tax=Kockovaella imperatae TaxID=4999 RepID=A0A1Y1ULB7_9TREE|nr:hypothetical protein BD324DRAFT_576967 [Kockovaella imperatae]ORX38840.1 hypothetical protein BD324DRAFT_576967 [Kockovaella imperatae]